MGIYDTLNEQQQEAVFCTEGPLLLLAGAGSGKTRVLTHRIAYLMDQGVNPYHIMAITFTNKAAKEMRERVDDLVGFGAEHIWVSTFHSTCVRILRRHIDKLGYGNSFTIYDADDQKSLIKQICKQYKIDTKMMPERRIINEISSAKDEFMTPSEYETRHQYDFKKKKIAQIYKEYQKQLKANNAKTKHLFTSSLKELELAMQAVMVLNNTTVNSDGTYVLPKGFDRSWFEQIKPNAKEQTDAYSSNAFLELYQQVEELMNPLKSGKTENMKRLDQLLALYPKALVDKLMKNDEFWMLADKLPSKAQTKLINGLAKHESFGQAITQGKWIPKIDTLGKGYQWFNKMTNPIKTYVNESLKNSQFIQGAKNWGVAKGLGSAAQIATYAQLGVTFVSSGVNEYGKTGSIGKGVIGGAIDTVKSIGPLEGMTIGGAVAGPFGAIVGGTMGLINKGAQFLWPNMYDDIKDGAYKLYDKSIKVVDDVSKKVGKITEQSINTVEQVYDDVQQVGKTIGKALSSVEILKIRFSW